MDILFAIAIAGALLILLWVAVRRNVSDASRAAEPDFEPCLPPRALMQRILSIEDVEFAAVLQAPGVLRLLLEERRRLALAWLRQTRREAGRLVERHVREARHAAGLRPAIEIRLFAHMTLFLATYQVLLAGVWFWGPFRTRRYLLWIRGLSDLLSDYGGRMADLARAGSAPAPRAASNI